MLVNTVNGIIAGIISGIVSAAIFHIILKRTTPKIKISDQIEKRIENGKAKYHIKIVNLRKRYVVNVMPYLDLAHLENGSDGRILRLRALKVCAEDIPFIDPYNKRDAESKYAVRFEITDRLEDIWDNDASKALQLQIYCVDEFSGSGKLFHKTYFQRTCIVTGKFKTGKSLDVDPL